MILKRMALVGVIVMLVLSSACSTTLPEQNESNRQDAQDALAQLENADTIKLKKKVLVIGDEWEIFVGDDLVAEMKGLELPVVGDTYSLLSPSGGFMGGEDEDIINISTTANFYDMDSKPTGQLKKKLVSLMASYTLRDTDDELVAKLDQKFNVGFKATIQDKNKRDAWAVKRKVLSLGAKITMEREVDTSVTALDAIRMVAVANEVYEAEAQSN